MDVRICCQRILCGVHVNRWIDLVLPNIKSYDPTIMEQAIASSPNHY